MLCNTFLLLLVLLKAVNIRAQCQRPTLPANVILKGDSYKEIYEKDSTARLECALGYTPATYVSRTIKCLGGIWTETEFRCKKKSCGALKDIPHGRYLITEGIEFGAKVKAECDLGHVLYGSDTRVCRHNGWSGRDLECEVVKCTEVPTIANGKPEEEPYSQYEFGQSISYRCNKDFDMFGDSTITCSTGGDFQPAPPECLRITLPPTTTPAPISTAQTTVSVPANQTWIERFFLRSWSGVPLWYDVIRWVLFITLAATVGLVQLRTCCTRNSRNKVPQNSKNTSDCTRVYCSTRKCYI